MIVYFLMYTLLLCTTGIVGQTGTTIAQKNKRSAIYAATLVVLVVALRHPSMGVDLGYGRYYGYLVSFQEISQYSWTELFALSGWLNYEWGYIIFNKLLGYISTDYQCLLIACAIATIIPIGIMIWRDSEDPVFAIIIYLGLPIALVPFSALRQGIAVGICCLSYPLIRSRKKIKFILLVMFATLFHFSAFFFVIAYPLYHLKLSKTVRMASIPALAVVFVARYPLFIIASKLFKDNAVVQRSNAFTLMLVFALMYTFCVLFAYDEKNKGFLNVFYMACVAQCFGSVYSIAIRVGYYFMPALVIALPNIIHNMKKSENRKISRLCVMTVFVIYGLYMLYSSGKGWAMTYPYYFFWQNIYG